VILSLLPKIISNNNIHWPKVISQPIRNLNLLISSKYCFFTDFYMVCNLFHSIFFSTNLHVLHLTRAKWEKSVSQKREKNHHWISQGNWHRTASDKFPGGPVVFVNTPDRLSGKLFCQPLPLRIDKLRFSVNST
jgi:hypothetical protein